jgi:serine/threonine-protein kinase
MVDSVVEELARKRLGRTIKGKWRLDRLIGVGGMAAVYAATHRNGARVAIKMLHPTISASTQIRARFIREGYLANKVDHPGVVRILDDDIDDTDQSAFLVMDLVVGVTLADRAMERLLDAGEVLDVADQVLQVLAAAHDKGIIHRDLKPDNLLVDKNGKVHVLDFGIARLLDDATLGVSATKTGTAFGTPGFMAPEQALGKTSQISARTDLYALGATLFALVCGDFVHAAENPQELLVLVATQPARSLGDLAPEMHPDVVAIIDKATRIAPDERWASALAMLDAVRRVRESLGVTSVRVLPLGGDAPLASMPSPLAGPSQEPDLADSSAPKGFAPIDFASNPGAMTVGPSDGNAALTSSSPFEITGPSETPRRKPKLLPLAVVGGGAALIGIVAIIASTTGRADSQGPPPSAAATSEAAPERRVETPTPPPVVEPASAVAAGSDTLPPVVSAETLEPTTPVPHATAAAGTKKGSVPTAKTATKPPVTTPTPAPSGKKFDPGY